MLDSTRRFRTVSALILMLALAACSEKTPAPETAEQVQTAAEGPAGAPLPEFKDTRPSDPVQREFDKLLQLAELGDSNAQARIAWMYRNGEGVEKNDQLAFQWMKKSAEKGDSVAQDNLGVFYRDGIGTEINKAEAVSWFKKSALQGNPEGQGNLGQALIDGSGVERNYYLGYVWSGISAKSGKSEFAKNNLVQVGGALKPEERDKADQVIADWTPGREPSGP